MSEEQKPAANVDVMHVSAATTDEPVSLSAPADPAVTTCVTREAQEATTNAAKDSSPTVRSTYNFDETAGGSVVRTVIHDPATRELPSFGSKYETLSLLGSGGMSVVYKVKHKLVGKISAAKMLHNHMLRENEIRRFQAEAKALFALDHPNIVHVREFDCTPEGEPFLIMDYLAGSSLSEELKRLQVLPIPRALTIFQQACDALQHAHNHGIVHRDIKPSNIVLSQDDQGLEQVKLVDFGIAKLTHDETPQSLTATGDVFGSPPYMSPEQCLGHKLDPRSDMYSLGCVMYEALSGQPPFTAKSSISIIHMHTNATPEPIQIPNCEERLRERLDEIIFKTLEKDPAKRYASMDDLKKDLLELQESTGWRKSTGVYLKYTRSQRRVTQYLRKHPILFALVAALVLGCSTSSVFFAWNYYEKRIVPLQAPPAVTLDSVNWQWVYRETQPDPVDVARKINLAEVIIDNYKLHSAPDEHGLENAEVMDRQAELENFLISHGHWSNALKWLEKRVTWLTRLQQFERNKYDTRLGYALLDSADCLAMRNSPQDAYYAYWDYQKAEEIFDQNEGFEDHSTRALTKIKQGLMALKIGLPNSALPLFVDKDGQIYDDAMAQTGYAEALLRIASKSKNPADRDRKIDQARNYFQRAMQRINSPYEKGVCIMRLADCDIVQGKYGSALQKYINQSQSPTWKSYFENNAAIQRNYALLLWHTNNWLTAPSHMEPYMTQASIDAANEPQSSPSNREQR